MGNDEDIAKLFNETDCEMILMSEEMMEEKNVVQEKIDNLAELFNQTDHEMETMAENNHLCRKCGLSFTLEENLKVHEERCNNSQKKYRCEHWNKKFNRKKYKDLHQKSCGRV